MVCDKKLVIILVMLSFLLFSRLFSLFLVLGCDLPCCVFCVFCIYYRLLVPWCTWMCKSVFLEMRRIRSSCSVFLSEVIFSLWDSVTFMIGRLILFHNDPVLGGLILSHRSLRRFILLRLFCSLFLNQIISWFLAKFTGCYNGCAKTHQCFWFQTLYFLFLESSLSWDAGATEGALTFSITALAPGTAFLYAAYSPSIELFLIF